MKEHGPLAGIPPEFAHEGHPVWDVIAPRDGVGGFLPAEFRYPWKMDVRFMALLYLLRLAAGVPFRISSDHRLPDRNQAVGGAERSAHKEEPCAAVDLRVLNNHERFRIAKTALAFGVHRIGMAKYAMDPKTGAGIIHIDCARTLPPDVCW